MANDQILERCNNLCTMIRDTTVRSASTSLASNLGIVEDYVQRTNQTWNQKMIGELTKMLTEIANIKSRRENDHPLLHLTRLNV